MHISEEEGICYAIVLHEILRLLHQCFKTSIRHIYTTLPEEYQLRHPTSVEQFESTDVVRHRFSTRTFHTGCSEFELVRKRSFQTDVQRIGSTPSQSLSWFGREVSKQTLNGFCYNGHLAQYTLSLKPDQNTSLYVYRI